MRFYFIILLVLLSISAFSQSDFVKSIFYNIPFDINIDSTSSFLNTQTRFKNKYDAERRSEERITYDIPLENVIPNKAKGVVYSKNRFRVMVDSVAINSCLTYRSSIEFWYSSNLKGYLKDIKTIPGYLESKLRLIKIISLTNALGGLYGYEFYLSDNPYCNMITVSWEDECGMRYIAISYQ